MKKQYQSTVIRLVFPTVMFGAITGVLTAALVVFYKFCAKNIIGFSESGYDFLKQEPIWIPLVLVGLLGVAFLFSYIYKKAPNMRGGGIPTTIGVLRGLISMKWLQNVIGVFALSLTGFLIGVPLGNEGPSVQMGAAIGRGSVFMLTRKKRAWDRYAMTGGACAGFSVATGAPISGIFFAIEEAHQRITPSILIMATSSVMFAEVTNQFLSPLLGVSPELFDISSLRVLSTKELWIPLLIGVAVGLFAVLFLRYYRLLRAFYNKKLKKVPHWCKIFAVFCLTLGLGLCSYSFISTGHHLMLSLFDLASLPAVWVLLLILVVRATLTLSANTNRITGGIFLPILALGTLLSAALGKGVQELFGLGQDYYTVILILGITACIAGMMKMPLTAIVFSVEALSGYGNIISVIVVATVAFIITEIFSAHSINDIVLDTRVAELREGKVRVEIDSKVTVQEGSFAIGKQIRDIFWPHNMLILSVQHDNTHNRDPKAHGGKELQSGDVLHIHCNTYDVEQTRVELESIIGEQK